MSNTIRTLLIGNPSMLQQLATSIVYQYIDSSTTTHVKRRAAIELSSSEELRALPGFCCYGQCPDAQRAP